MTNPDLSKLDIVIAVSGLKTGDNPQPGVPVIRSIMSAGFKGKIVGLVYDSMESGIYVDDLADMVFQMPYPSAGPETFLSRIDYILQQTKIDVVIPTLDSEIISYIRLRDELLARGIHTFLPEEEHFLLRDKTKLAGFFPEKGIQVPQTKVISDPSQIKALDVSMEYPVIIKGRFYEAFKAHTPEEALKYYYEIEHKWGLPIIVQEIVSGDEFNIVMVGDGEGGVVGMVPQRKLVITDKGKGFGGVVVNNPILDAFARKAMSLLKWRGPLELELIKGFDDICYLIEINPRFPAWVRLAEGAGQNLPAATVLLSLGLSLEQLPPYKAGTFFIRHCEDIISNISMMGEVSAKGELSNESKNHIENGNAK
jgi:carbamoyl-phosphate synthase large subunit